MGIPLSPSQSVEALKVSTEALPETSHVTPIAEGGAFATGALDYTADVLLTETNIGTVGNTKTFKTVINAAAANPTNTVLAAFTGTAAAIILTITPNDGTHNSATPVTLTTAQIAELINTGLVAGKVITLTDASSLRGKQTATGGGATPVVAAGEGDNVTATFADGVASALINKYFGLHDGADAAFYVWFNVNAEGVDPTPGGTGIPVALAGGETAAQVASAIQAAVDADSHFDADVEGGDVQITNADSGVATDVDAGTSGFTVANEVQGQVETYSPGMSPTSINMNP